MRQYIWLAILVLFCQIAKAQLGTLKGSVIDTAEKKPIARAVVALLDKDSTLLFFTRSDQKGNFQLLELPFGEYKILVTSSSFADFSEFITIKETVHDLTAIPLTGKLVLLQEVIVRNTNPIRLKGDTTEFVADSFAVKEGATVEDLLKRLPGFQVNSKGEITAQGKRVDKVLVDGEEFFGDDPTVATQNLSARAVDKVQVYTTKTEEQKLTGISNGSEGKTLNIKLKESSKRGLFGKIIAGSDFNNYNDVKVLYNRFKGKKKFSLYGTRSDLSTGNLNSGDQQKLGIEEEREYDEARGIFRQLVDDDEVNSLGQRGLPHSYSAGVLYLDKWDSDKYGVNTSYRFNRLKSTNEQSIFTQNILPTTVNYRNIFSNNETFIQQHYAMGKWEWKPTALTSFKFVTAGKHTNTDADVAIRNEFLNQKKEYINRGTQDRTVHTERDKWENQIQYKQLFKKPNRQFLASVRFGLNDGNQKSIYRTTNNFYDNANASDSISITDQMVVFNSNAKTVGSKITYSEPLSKRLGLIGDYSHNRNVANSHHNTFNKNGDDKYEVLDPLFSNNFDMNAYSNSGTAFLKLTDKKLVATVGSGLSNLKMRLHDLDKDVVYKYNFINYLPQAALQLIPNAQTNITFSYYGYTNQPSIGQLQPIRTNDDPLYQFQGNPDLKVGFTNRVQFFFSKNKAIKRTYFYIQGSGNASKNDIANLTIIDTSLGKQIYMPINVNGNKNWTLSSYWTKWGGDKKWGFVFGMTGNGGTNNNLIQQQLNIQKNRTEFTSVRLMAGANYNRLNYFSIDIQPTIGYNRSRSSINSGIKNNYLTYGGSINGFIRLPLQIELASEINFNLREKLPEFPGDHNITFWKASLSRQVFKKKTGRFVFEANDILNQNRGFNRIINSSFVQEERYQRVSQYFLLRFEWTFNKTPNETDKK
jgi:hypothetical protein